MTRHVDTNEPLRPRRGGSSFGEGGFVLIAVLWFGLGLSAVASYLLISAQYQARLAQSFSEDTRHQVAIRDAAAHWTVAALRNDDANLASGDPSTRAIRRDFGGEEVLITLTPREVRIDLNRDDAARMAIAIADAGVDADLAADLAARIVDFRDTDDLRQLNGAERDDYAAAGREGPRNGAFIIPDDLSLVLGMTPALMDQLRPIVSIEGRPISQEVETGVTVVGNRINPLNGGRQIAVIQRPSLYIHLEFEDGADTSFPYFR